MAAIRPSRSWGYFQRTARAITLASAYSGERVQGLVGHHLGLSDMIEGEPLTWTFTVPALAGSEI